ncbi:Nucleolysin TIAR, partial [Cichlidogyrus casuarinus]
MWYELFPTVKTDPQPLDSQAMQMLLQAQQTQQLLQQSTSNAALMQNLFGKELKLPSSSCDLNKGAILPPPGQKIDTSKHFHIFVGDLAPEIDAHHLREAFSIFGFVTECKIIKDMHTHKPKGYGFVAYATHEEAEQAKTRMNGQMLGSRSIRTNWAVRKPPQPPGKEHKPLNADEVALASSATNSTIYVGAVNKALEE